MNNEILSSRPSIFDDILGREHGNDCLAILGNDSSNYGQLLRESAALAKCLKKLGISKRCRIVLCLPHGKEYCLALFAIYQLEAVAVLVDPLATVSEQHFIVEDALASYLLAPASGMGSQIGSSFNLLATLGSIQVFNTRNDEMASGPTDTVIIYTSGTTGRAKGVILTKGSISSNVRAVADYLALCPGDRGLIFTPPALAFALSQVLTHFWSRASLLLWKQGLMFPAQLLSVADQFRITGIACNPSSIRMILRNASVPSFNGDSIRYVMLGGQPLLTEDVKLIRRCFRQCRILNMYGCSENSPRVAYYWLPDDAKLETPAYPVGQPIRGTQIRLLTSSGTEAQAGEIGEVLVGGASLALGYWQNASLTKQQFKDGWFYTKDYGFIDNDGNLNLIGRMDTILNVGHFKVAPEEVEIIINEVEGIADVGIAGKPDHLLGTVPVALVVVKQNSASIIKNAQIRCCQKLSRHKVPVKFIVVDSIPRTTYGKIDRLRLKQLAEQTYSNI